MTFYSTCSKTLVSIDGTNALISFCVKLICFQHNIQVLMTRVTELDFTSRTFQKNVSLNKCNFEKWTYVEFLLKDKLRNTGARKSAW